MSDPLFLSITDPAKRKAALLEQAIRVNYDMRAQIAATPDRPIKDIINDTTYLRSLLHAIQEIEHKAEGQG